MRTRIHAGFTLLEVLLAIAITVLVLGLVGTALYLQLRTIDGTRGEVEQAQVARALLRHIGDDLRSVIKYAPVEVSLPGGAGAAAGAAGATGMGDATGAGGTGSSSTGGTGTGGMGTGGTGQGGATGGASGSGGSQGGSGSTGGGSGGGGSGGSGSTSGGSQTPSSSSTSGANGGSSSESSTFSPDTIPGVRGSVDFIKIDISRLPRRDQLLAAEQGVGGRASDVKTVVYFVDDPSTTLDGAVGLKRYEVSRAESLMSAEEGSEEELMRNNSKLLADEVVRVRFEYSDGEQWYESWPPTEPQDEMEAAQLPLAVHVVLYLKPPGFDAEYAGQAWSGLDMSGFPQRRMVVPLPAAELGGSSSQSSDSSSSSKTSGSNNSSGSSPSTSGSGGTGGSGATPGGSGGSKRGS